MTGEGTKGAPLVPSDWAELIAAIGTPGAYVKMPEGAVWNMDEQLPGGIKNTTYPISCAELDGRGSEIQNLRAVNSSHVFSVSRGTAIKDIALTNMEIVLSNTGIYGLFAGGMFTMERCELAGILQNMHLSAADGGVTCSSCNFTVELSGGSALTQNAMYMYDCLLDLSGESSNSQNVLYCYNCYFMGKNPFSGSGGLRVVLGANNVVDMESESKLDFPVGLPASIANSDKIAEEADVSGLTLVTEEQLGDAEYLRSLGFPIRS